MPGNDEERKLPLPNFILPKSETSDSGWGEGKVFVIARSTSDEAIQKLPP
jgi:hypothetical protein